MQSHLCASLLVVIIALTPNLSEAQQQLEEKTVILKSGPEVWKILKHGNEIRLFNPNIGATHTFDPSGKLSECEELAFTNESLEFVLANKEIFGIQSEQNLCSEYIDLLKWGVQVSYIRVYDNYKVEDSHLFVVLLYDGSIFSAGGNYLPNLEDINLTISFSPDQAVEEVCAKKGLQKATLEEKEPVIKIGEDCAHLCWKISGERKGYQYLYYVSCLSAEIVAVIPDLQNLTSWISK